MNNFTLKIFTQIHSNDYDDNLEKSYPCKLSYDDGVYRIKYTAAEAGFTVVKVTDDSITVRRQNSFTIVLKEGYLHTVNYDSPYGSIPMEFTAQSIICSLSKQGGRLEYTAKLVIGGAPQTNIVLMEITPENA